MTKIGTDIFEAAELIRAGGLVAFPTETVYGLGADGANECAVRSIFSAKGRPEDNPLILHVSGVLEAEKVAILDERARLLFSLFAPGPLTLVLPKKAHILDVVTAGLPTVGVRIPSHPMTLEFLKACGTPVAAPSANLSKRVSPTTAQFVYEDMAGRIPLILDGGDCDVGIESTILTLATDIPTVLRPGAVTLEMLSAVLPLVKNHTGEVKIATAPGMKYKHYAPLCPCFLFSDSEKAKSEYTRWEAMGKKAVILAKDQTISNFKEMDRIALGTTGEEIAKCIFRVLRECEKNYDCILIERLSDIGIESSVMNRLFKSTEGKIL